MEYQKIINFLDNTPNQPTKYRTKTMTHLECITLIVKLSLKLQC